jgi:pSer/pThr/pTyr-binding forkhead associated (FHA) protein
MGFIILVFSNFLLYNVPLLIQDNIFPHDLESKLMHRIILKHISGSKANQVDEFPVDQYKALTLGRDTDQTVHYDPDRDDLVSKQHARIFCEEGHDDKFLITDLNSRNGTYVNKRRISDTASIVPGDVIQLGPGGPEFQFDLEPPPDSMLRPTREAEPVRETRESVSNPSLSSALTKPPVGRATVERMLSVYQQSSRRTLVNLAAIMVGVHESHDYENNRWED